MNNTLSETGGGVTLPGLAKLFLIQAYVLLPAFAALQAVFFFASGEAYRGEELIEVTFWHIACFGLCVWNLIVIVGLHTRAAWAPDNAIRFCWGLIVFAVAVAVRLLTVMGDMRLSLDYGYGDFYEMYVVMLPAFLAVTCLQLYAWSKYFQFSSKLRAAFGLEAPATDAWGQCPSRPLGIALLHLFCGGFLLFYLAFFPSLWIAARSLNGTIIGLILLMVLPKVIFPILLLAFSWRPGARFLPLHVCFGAWLVVNVLWVTLLPAFAFSGLFEFDGHLFYQLNAIVGAYPVSGHVLPVLLGALWWRLTASQEDSAWFAGRTAWTAPVSSRLMLFLSGYACHYLVSQGGYFVHGLIMQRGAMEIVLTSCLLALLILAGLTIRWNLKEDPRARPAFLALAGGAILLLLGVVWLVVAHSLESSSMNFAFIYSLPYLAEEMAIMAGGVYFVMRGRPGTSLELTVFKLFCLGVACMFIVPRLAQFVFMLAVGDTGDIGQAFLMLLGGVSKEPLYYGDRLDFVFSPAALAAFLILPFMLLSFLRAGRVERLYRPTLLACLGVWLLLVQITAVVRTALLLVSGSADMFMAYVDPKVGIISAVLLLFTFFFCSSSRLAGRGRRP